MASNRFYEVAEKALSNSPVLQGREKLTTEQVIRDYPNGITLTAFDILDNGKDGYAVFAFREDDRKFINGGALLTKMALEWVREFNGDIQEASDALGAEGGVRVRLTPKRTKRGNNITSVELLR